MSTKLWVCILLTLLISSCDLLDDFIEKNQQEEGRVELAALFQPDYIDDYSAILIEDGYALLSNPNKLCLAKYDFTSEQWNSDLLFTIELDSLGRTSSIYLLDEDLNFYDYSDDKVSILHIVGNTHQIYDNLDFIQNGSKES